MIRIGAGELAVESTTSSLRAALALSCAAGAPLRWEGFRRKSAGLRPVDAETVRLFAAMTGARVDGGEVGDTTVELEPGSLAEGERRYDVSSDEPMLPVLRAALLPLALAGGDAPVTFGGSTHAPADETFEVVNSTFRHFLLQLGVGVELSLECAGFAPRGGGEVAARLVDKASAWSPVTLDERPALESIQIVSAGASLPAHVQQRQAARARSGVHISGFEPTVQLLKIRARGAGSVVAITGQFGDLPVTFASVSRRGKSAESVGEQAAASFRRYAKQPAVVPEGLVDALVPFLAFAEGESQITTPRVPPSLPAVAALTRAFTGRGVHVDGKVGQPARIRVSRPGLQT